MAEQSSSTLTQRREALHRARRALQEREAQTVAAHRATVQQLEHEVAVAERAEGAARHQEALRALRHQWDDLAARKIAAWGALDRALDAVNLAWEQLVHVHAQQAAVCQDLPALSASAVGYWLTHARMPVLHGDTPNGTLVHPRDTDPGVVGQLHQARAAGGRWVGLLALPRDPNTRR